jgi:arylsulfatase A-like enzyme
MASENGAGLTGLTRRRALGTSAAAAAATGAKAATGERPNILWLVSEDNNPFIGAYGDTLAHTPTIDRLARDGVLYRHAYSTAPVCAPSRFALITGAHAESNAPANQMRAVSKLPKGWRTTPEFLREAGYHCTNNAKTDYNCAIEAARVWNRSGTDAHWRQRPAGAPFFAVFNYEATHESQLFKPTPGRVTPDQVRVPAYLPDAPEIRVDIASYYNLMERMDGQIAARLAELEADGLADNTIVFYYSDNGGALPRSKRYCYEEGLRCALIVRFPPRWAHLAPTNPGGVVEEPVSFIDLPPTVLALGGVARPPQMQGRPLFPNRRRRGPAYAFGMRNRMDERYDMVRSVTDGRYRYVRNYMPHRPAGQNQAYAWQAKGYQAWETSHRAGGAPAVQEAFWKPRPFEELFDLSNDRDQLTDLTAEPAHAAALRRLRRALDGHMLAINDNGFIPEGSPLEGFDASRAPGAYPLARVMALASAAGARDPGRLGLFRVGIDDPNEVIRYWAATGLAILGTSAAPALGDVRRRLTSEPSPQVRAALAEALCGAGDPEQGVAALAGLLSADTLPVKLQALNALTWVGPAASAALPAIRAAGANVGEPLRSASLYLSLSLEGRYTPTTPVFDNAAFMRGASAVTR